MVFYRADPSPFPPIRTEQNYFPGHFAVSALMDYGDAAIPPLKELLFHGDERERRNAAHTLLGFKFQDLVALTPELKAAIKKELPETEDSMLHQDWVEAGA